MLCHDMMSILYTKWQLNFDIQPDKLQYIFVGIVHKMIDISIDI